MSHTDKIIVVTGPTASGKTEIVAKLLSIFHDKLIFISSDSRKIYRFMDIGTAKPPSEIRKFYRLIDIRRPDELYSAQDFALDAEREIQRALDYGKIPIVVGGTILYLKALFEGFFESPPIDQKIKEDLQKRLESQGVAKLYEELKAVDAETAERVHPNDWFRIIRALEVYYQTGKPISMLRKESRRMPKFKPIYFFNDIPRPELYERINRRVDRMIEMGFVDEVRKLMEMGFDLRLPSMNTIGYRELYLYLRGEMDFETAVRLTKKHTRTFARRQFYFSRSLEGINYIPRPLMLERLTEVVREMYL